MRLTNIMKDDAMRACVKDVYEKKLTDLSNSIKKEYLNSTVKLPENIKSEKWFKDTPDEYKNRVRSASYVSTVSLVTSHSFDNYRVSVSPIRHILFDFPRFIINEHAYSEKLKTLVKKLEIEIKNANDFISELKEALTPITTDKKLADLLPNMSKYFNTVGDKKDLVSLKKYKDINAKIDN